MSLGEAFIEVRADLRPFGRDLRRNLRPMVRAFERELNDAVGGAMAANAEGQGERIGTTLSRGIRNSLTHQLGNRNAFITIASALAGALDDGISALPTEVKAAIVVAILATAPLIGGALGALIVAGVGAAVVGIGVLLASQFEQVQTRFEDFTENVRTSLVESATRFAPAVINALTLIEDRIQRLRPILDEIFNVSAEFVEPLVNGLLSALENVIGSIHSSLNELKPFIDELGSAFITLGKAIGDAFTILVATGEDGRKAFRDLTALVAGFILGVAGLIFVLAKLYGAFRTVIGAMAETAAVLFPLAFLLNIFFETVDRRANENKSFVNTNTNLTNSFGGLITATDAETQALKRYSAALEKASNAVKSQLELNISWEESLDRITESIKENGKTLDIRNEKGRANAREFLNALEIAEERTVKLLQSGTITNEQAVAQYDEQTAALRRMAVQAGLSEDEFNELFGQIIETGRLRLSSEEMGIDSLASELGVAGGAAAKLLELLTLVKHLSGTMIAGGVAGGLLGTPGLRGYSDGGIQFVPTVSRLAEDGAEAIIPLTKPARAAAIMKQSGLSSMLGGSGVSTFMVFIGNEQLDSRMVKVVERTSQAQALALNHGGRRL